MRRNQRQRLKTATLPSAACPTAPLKRSSAPSPVLPRKSRSGCFMYCLSNTQSGDYDCCFYTIHKCLSGIEHLLSPTIRRCRYDKKYKCNRPLYCSHICNATLPLNCSRSSTYRLTSDSRTSSRTSRYSSSTLCSEASPSS
jgi:hypothetical protein